LKYIVKSVQTSLEKQTIQLKIRLLNQNRLITFQFKLHATVKDAIDQIVDRIVVSGNVTNHGLFQGPDLLGEIEFPRWLDPQRTLSFYDLKPGDVLDFKNTQNLLKIWYLGPWPTTKTLIVDESKTVAEITLEITSKLKIDAEEFSLQVPWGESTGVWLNPTKSLVEQGVDTMTTILLLRKKFFFKINRDMEQFFSPDTDDYSLNKAFCESLDAVLSGTNPCPLESAVKLVALQCQVRFGDYESPEILENFNWDEYLSPENSAQSKKISNDVLFSYRSLNGVKTREAKAMYISEASKLKTHGYTFLQVEKKDQQGIFRPILLGISKKKMVLLDPITKEVVDQHQLTELVQWIVQTNTLIFNYLDGTDTFQTNQSQAVSLILTGYIEFIMKK